MEILLTWILFSQFPEQTELLSVSTLKHVCLAALSLTYPSSGDSDSIKADPLKNFSEHFYCELCTWAYCAPPDLPRPSVYVLANIQMISCSTSTDGASVVQWDVCEYGLPNMPTGPASSPWWRSCLSVSLLPGPTMLPLQRRCSYYPLGIIILHFTALHSLSLSARLGLDTEVQAEGRRAAALCSQRAERHSLHCGSEQVGGDDAKGEKGRVVVVGGVTHWMPRPLGWRRGGGGGPAAQQPTYMRLPFSLSITSFLSHLFSLSVPGLRAGCSSQCHRCLVPLTAAGGMLQSWAGQRGKEVVGSKGRK